MSSIDTAKLRELYDAKPSKEVQEAARREVEDSEPMVWHQRERVRGMANAGDIEYWIRVPLSKGAWAVFNVLEQHGYVAATGGGFFCTYGVWYDSDRWYFVDSEDERKFSICLGETGNADEAKAIVDTLISAASSMDTMYWGDGRRGASMSWLLDQMMARDRTHLSSVRDRTRPGWVPETLTERLARLDSADKNLPKEGA